MVDDGARRTTYFSKSPLTCPLCETTFFREDLLSGGGRLIAGELTDELHRTYEPSRRFGELHPLIYAVLVCPSCLLAAYPQDFEEAQPDTVPALEQEAEQRKKAVSQMFKKLDFAGYRELKEGIASYYLAMQCYEHFDRHLAPTFKQGLCALRAAWLLETLHRKEPGNNYDYLARVFYRKACFLYTQAVELAQSGQEPLEASVNYGPDLDKNYGYEGLLYLSGLLEYKYGPRRDPARRVRSLERAKRTVSKLFGTGKASRSKPSAILDKAREVYDEMNREIKVLQGQG
jgi:uncharacterized protein (DUF2225 family)